MKVSLKTEGRQKTHPTSVKSRQQMNCSLTFTSKVSLRKVSLREPPGGQILTNYAYQRYLYYEI